MTPARIADLLEPFLASALSNTQLAQISTYIDLLLRWNARINLTSIRNPESIVTRHFGESLFAAQALFPPPNTTAGLSHPHSESAPPLDLLDLGSGAGFPGLPIKLWAPDLRTTLLESQNKKVAFLREVIRSLTLTGIDVVPARAETISSKSSVVSLRAVENFESILPTAARLVAPQGRLALLVGESQIARAHRLCPTFSWQPPLPIPQASARVLQIAVAS